MYYKVHLLIISNLLCSSLAFPQTFDFSDLNRYYWRSLEASASKWCNGLQFENGEKVQPGKSLSKGLEQQYKSYFIIGLIEMGANLELPKNLYYGWENPTTKKMMCSSYDDDPADFIRGITVGQFVQGLDHFYIDYRNTGVRILEAMRIVSMEINGKSQESIEWWARYYRASQDDKIEMWKEGPPK